MDPATMGEAWNRARQNYQNFPVQEGEAVARQFNPSVRQEIGAAIAGEGGGRDYGSELRRRAAEFAVGSSGLDTGMGALDFVPYAGQALGATDIAHDIGQGDYGSAAAGAALPVAMTAAQRFAGPIGRGLSYAGEKIAEHARPIAGAAGVAAALSPEDAEAANVRKALEAIASARAIEKAKEKGFDTSKVWYHSSLEPIKEFRPHGDYMGRSGVSGIHLAETSEMANRYLDRYGNYNYKNEPFSKNVMPVFVKMENTLEQNAPFKTNIGMGMPVPEGYENPLIKMGYDSLLRDEAINSRGEVKHVDPSFRGAIKGKELVLTHPSQVRSIYDEYAVGGHVDGYGDGGLIKKLLASQRNAEASNFHPRTFYHATHKDFPAFDISRSGKGSTIGGNEPAAFLTDKPAVADSYLAGNYVDRSAPAVQSYGSADLGEGVGRTYARGSNVMPLRVRDLEQFHDWDMGGGSYSPSHMEAAIQQAREEGAPGVIFRNMRDPGMMTANGPLGSPREPSNILAVLDPAYLRSIWADFDPAKKESRDLLASIGGAGALGASAAAMPEDVPHEARGGSVEDRALMLVSKQA
jgi:hypothetical protein